MFGPRKMNNAPTSWMNGNQFIGGDVAMSDYYYSLLSDICLNQHYLDALSIGRVTIVLQYLYIQLDISYISSRNKLSPARKSEFYSQ